MSKYSKKTKSKQTNNNLFIALAAVVVLAAGLAAILTGGGQSEVAGSLPRDVSVDQAAELRGQGAFMLDVRTQEEWDEVHIPGAVLIPLDELPSRLDEVPKDAEVVVYCRSGNRSLTGRDILLGAGFQEVTSMLGGIKEWQSSGYPLEFGP